MQIYTAKQLHDNPSEVYRAAVKGPVKITHKHHGDFVISSSEAMASAFGDCTGMKTTVNNLDECFGIYD